MSDQEQTYYFYFLSKNLSYIIKLKENQKLLEKKNDDLEKINENITKENNKLKILNQQLEEQKKEELNRKDQEIDEIKKINQQLEIQKKKKKKMNQKEMQNNISFEIIKKLLTTYGDVKNFYKSEISLKYSSKFFTGCMPNRKSLSC